MSMTALNLILDISILVCLVFTIYYALRLSKNLNDFRAHRKEFEGVIAELSRNINVAQKAIGDLRESSQIYGQELQDIIGESQHMADDLRLVNEASDSLAERLENLAGRNSRIVQGVDDLGDYEDEDDGLMEGVADEPESFSIQDPDFQGAKEDYDVEDEDAYFESEDQEFQSQAEKELYEALRQNKKRRAVG